MQKIRGVNEKLVELAAGAPGILMSAIGDPEFRKTQAELVSTAKKIYHGRISEAIGAAEKLANLKDEKATVLLHLLRFQERDLTDGDGGAQKRRAARIKRALEALWIAETTNVNIRLATDVLLMNLHSGT